MQGTVRAIIKDGWVCCAKCGHKLGRVTGKTLPTGIEIKCSSCKQLNVVKSVNYKVPHCEHCKNYHGFTGNCLKAVQELVGKRSNASAKAYGSRTCGMFEPTDEYKDFYRGIKL